MSVHTCVSAADLFISRLIDYAMVDLIVETADGESRFTLPKQYLTVFSPYFQKFLSGDLMEFREQVLQIGEVVNGVIQTFNAYLRNGTLSLIQNCV
jgi:hypothetical protein